MLERSHGGGEVEKGPWAPCPGTGIIFLNVGIQKRLLLKGSLTPLHFVLFSGGWLEVEGVELGYRHIVSTMSITACGDDCSEESSQQ